MNLITKLKKEMAINNLELKSDIGCVNCWVDITHINNPHSFYVRPSSYRSYISNLKFRGDKLQRQDLKLDMKIVYYSKDLKRYCRGVVSQIDTSNNKYTCDIFAIDYGFQEKSISLKEMFFLRYGHELPPLATHCQLENCEPLTGLWTDKAVDAMISYIGNERAILRIKGKTSNKLIVELINTCPEDIASLLALTGYSISSDHHYRISTFPEFEPDNPCYMNPQLNLGEMIRVKTLWGNYLHNFFVAEVDEYNDYLKNVKDFSANSRRKYALRPEDMKLAKPVSVYVPSFKRYERGMIQKILVPEEQATVVLIDWGCAVKAHISAIKPLSAHDFTRPVMAIYCSLVKRQQIYSVYGQYLEHGKEYLLTVKKVGDQFDKPNIVIAASLPSKI